MDYQDEIQRLEAIKMKATRIERETIAFYHQWQLGFNVAMHGCIKAKPKNHTVAYIEGLQDAILLMQIKNTESNLAGKGDPTANEERVVR